MEWRIPVFVLRSEIWASVIISALLVTILRFIPDVSPEQVLHSAGDVRVAQLVGLF